MTKRKAKHSPHEDILRPLGVFRAADAVALGVSQPTLSRLASSGVITRLEHGLYCHPDADVDPAELDLVIACIKFGKLAFIGGLTSLFRHGLISQVPDRIWVVVPSGVKSDSARYRCIRTKNIPQVGIENHKTYRIAGVDRSLVEALQFATKIGLQTAISATRKALAEGLTTEKQLYEMAQKLGAENYFLKYWEAIVAE